MQREAKAVLKGRLKEADHLGNGNNIRREKTRTPYSDSRRRSITSSEGFIIQRLNSSRAHDIRVPHSSPQILGATWIPNLANLPLALACQRKITYWKDPGNHGDRTIESVAISPDSDSSAGPPSIRRPTERDDPEEAYMIKRRKERMNKTMKEAEPQPNTP